MIAFYATIYIAGVILSFDVLMSRLKRKFPDMEYSVTFKFGVSILCLSSFLGLYFILTNDELGE